MFFQSKKVLGLDIGSTSIKLSELDVSRSGATLTGFAVASTPAQAVINGDIADATAISEVVAGLMQTLQTKRKFVATAISGNPVIVKRISIPKMEEKMIGEQIKWEAEQYLPFDISEVNLDYKVLKSSAENPENMDILLVAAKQEAVFKFSEIIEPLSKSLAIVDVAGFSLAHCFERNYGVAQDQSIALIDIGGAMTTVTIVDRGEIAFCRDIMLGGGSYTSEIQKGLGLNQNEAESMKISASQGQAVPDELMTIINSTHQGICEEIQASIEFFTNAANGSSLAACFVTGGGARTPGLMAQLGVVTKIQCQPLDPFRSVRYNSSKISPTFVSQISDICACSIGLGLRSIGDA